MTMMLGGLAAAGMEIGVNPNARRQNRRRRAFIGFDLKQNESGSTSQILLSRCRSELEIRTGHNAPVPLIVNGMTFQWVFVRRLAWAALWFATTFFCQAQKN